MLCDASTKWSRGGDVSAESFPNETQKKSSNIILHHCACCLVWQNKKAGAGVAVDSFIFKELWLLCVCIDEQWRPFFHINRCYVFLKTPDTNPLNKRLMQVNKL